jgi:hypothetical protein
MDMIRICVQGYTDRYERKGLYSIPDVFAEIGNSTAEFDGDIINCGSLRYLVFRQNLKCVGCGLEGQYFAKERTAKEVKRKSKKEKVHKNTTETWHFNLYGINYEGREILLTKDHIKAKSTGGAKHDLDNLQTMCEICNCKKGSDPAWQMKLDFPGAMSATA